MLIGLPIGFVFGWFISKVPNAALRWVAYLSASFVMWIVFLLGFIAAEEAVYGNVDMGPPAPGTFAMAGFIGGMICAAAWRRKRRSKAAVSSTAN